MSDSQKLICWTGGGSDHEQHFENRMNLYSRILDDGDFERWQKFCYMDKNSEEFKKGYINAVWIMQRFTEFGSPEWEKLCKILNEENS